MNKKEILLVSSGITIAAALLLGFAGGVQGVVGAVAGAGAGVLLMLGSQPQ